MRLGGSLGYKLIIDCVLEDFGQIIVLDDAASDSLCIQDLLFGSLRGIVFILCSSAAASIGRADLRSCYLCLALYFVKATPALASCFLRRFCCKLLHGGC